MTNAQLADLLEEAARRLRGMDPSQSGRRGMNTTELAKTVGVHPETIRRMGAAQEISATPIGDRHAESIAKRRMKLAQKS